MWGNNAVNHDKFPVLLRHNTTHADQGMKSSSRVKAGVGGHLMAVRTMIVLGTFC